MVHIRLLGIVSGTCRECVLCRADGTSGALRLAALGTDRREVLTRLVENIIEELMRVVVHAAVKEITIAHQGL